jgi:hypothetical protein
LGGGKLVLGVDGANDWTNLVCIVDIAICTITSDQFGIEALWTFYVEYEGKTIGEKVSEIRPAICSMVF